MDASKEMRTATIKPRIEFKIWTLFLILACSFAARVHAIPTLERPQSRKVPVVFTLDDIPVWFVSDIEERLQTYRVIRKTLLAHGIKPIVFVNPAFLADPAIDPREWQEMALWQSLGFQIANHTAHHLPRSEASEQKFFEDLDLGAQLLDRHLPGWDHDARFFRYPNRDYGPEQDRAKTCRKIRDRGYFIVPVSFDSFDWSYAKEYHAVAANRAKAQPVVDRAFRKIESEFKRATERMSSKMPLVMVMHSTRFTRHYLDRVLTLLERNGATWVSATPHSFYHYRAGIDCQPACIRARTCD